MEDEKMEFLKLDTIDRKVLFWIMENSPRAIPSWIDYIVAEYQGKKSIKIDPQKLAEETKQSSEIIESSDTLIAISN